MMDALKYKSYFLNSSPLLLWCHNVSKLVQVQGKEEDIERKERQLRAESRVLGFGSIST
jgi:hypothetical protein